MAQSIVDSSVDREQENRKIRGSTVAVSRDEADYKKSQQTKDSNQNNGVAYDDDDEGPNEDLARENKNVSRMSKKSEDSEIVMIRSSDINSNGKAFRRMATMKDNRTAMERFIDKFWLLNIERVEQKEER